MGTTVLRALIPDIHGLDHTVNANIPFLRATTASPSSRPNPRPNLPKARAGEAISEVQKSRAAQGPPGSIRPKRSLSSVAGACVGQNRLPWRDEREGRRIGAAQQVHGLLDAAFELDHLARAQADLDARRGIGRLDSSVLPNDRAHGAGTTLGHEEGDEALPANCGEDGLSRWNGADIGGRVVGSGRRIHSQKREKRSGDGSGRGCTGRVGPWLVSFFESSTESCRAAVHNQYRSAVAKSWCGARQMAAGCSRCGDWRFVSKPLLNAGWLAVGHRLSVSTELNGARTDLELSVGTA